MIINKKTTIKWICILILLLILFMGINTKESPTGTRHIIGEQNTKKSSPNMDESSLGMSYLWFESLLTAEEKEYIAKHSLLKAATINGAAPISFTDEEGNIQGIAQRVLDRISVITGLKFECRVYNSVEELFNSNCDVIYGVASNYVPDNIMLSQPFLETKTILYINSYVSPDELDNKLFAAIKGSVLPEGIKEQNIIYYNTGEESLNAVESGKADYGYGNAYSVAYYTLRNGYKNIVTVPISLEPREFCIAVLNNDEILLSIINKSLSIIDAEEMYKFVLEEASDIERPNTWAWFFYNYGRQILYTIFILLIIVLLSQLFIIRLNKKLIEQNRKYEVLSQISKEYRYEYFVEAKRLQLAEEFNDLFYTEESLNEVARILQNVLSNPNFELPNDLINLSLPDGQIKTFKVVKSNLLNHWGKTKCIIGKLIDVTEEAAIIKELLIKAHIDELTGLYNPAKTKDLINERLAEKEANNRDALILIDCDGFKNINDTYGHLAGNRALQHVALMMKNTFRSTDILGRLGGDEFCVYMKDVTSLGSVVKKSKIFIKLIHETTEFPNFSVSMGIALVKANETFEEIFNKADMALYQAKKNGKSRVVVYDEKKKQG